MSIRSRPKTLHPKNPGYLTRSDPSRKMDKRLKALRKKVKHGPHGQSATFETGGNLTKPNSKRTVHTK